MADRPVAQVGRAPGTQDPSERAAEQGAVQRRVVPQHSETGAERHADHGVDDDRDRVETGLVGVADDEADDETDHGAAAQRDRPTATGIVGSGERESERTECGGTGERSDDPGEEPGAGAERDAVAVQRDADDGTDDAEQDDVERQPARPDEVEQEVGPDPDASARRHGDEHGDHGGADLGFDEGPVDQAERR